jgi:ABC-type protease/lipase transport system fused ATPase/permease subunit
MITQGRAVLFFIDSPYGFGYKGLSFILFHGRMDMKKLATLIATSLICAAFATAALAADPLQKANDALGASSTAVDKASKKEADVKAKAAAKKDAAKTNVKKAKGKADEAKQKKDATVKGAKDLKDATKKDVQDLKK